MKDYQFQVVTWPDIQYYMDLPGFKENSVLINDEPLLKEFGPSAYLIRVSWLDFADLELNRQQASIEN